MIIKQLIKFIIEKQKTAFFKKQIFWKLKSSTFKLTEVFPLYFQPQFVTVNIFHICFLCLSITDTLLLLFLLFFCPPRPGPDVPILATVYPPIHSSLGHMMLEYNPSWSWPLSPKPNQTYSQLLTKLISEAKDYFLTQ